MKNHSFHKKDERGTLLHDAVVVVKVLSGHNLFMVKHKSLFKRRKEVPLNQTINSFCLVRLGSNSVTSKTVYASTDPVWNVILESEISTMDLNHLNIVIKVNHVEEPEGDVYALGDLEIPLCTILENNLEYYENEELFTLNSKQCFSYIKVKILFKKNIILSTKLYKEFLSILEEDHFLLVRVLAQLRDNRLDEVLTRCLVSVYHSRNKLAELVEDLLGEMIINSDDPTGIEILRGDSLASDLFELFMKLTCQDYLHSILQNFLIHVISTNLPCEICPSLLNESENITENLNNLLGYLTMVIRNITKSADSIPAVARRIFNRIQTLAIKKFSNPHIKYSVVSCFLFLRFINPALMSPTSYNLLQNQPPLNVIRTATYIAKTLQIIVSVSSSVKENYMLVLSDFIEQQREDMMGFIDQVCTITNLTRRKSKRKSKKSAVELEKKDRPEVVIQPPDSPQSKRYSLTLNLDTVKKAPDLNQSFPNSATTIPKLTIMDTSNYDISTDRYFCIQAAFIFRQFEKNFNSILQSLGGKYTLIEDHFQCIISKIQAQMEEQSDKLIHMEPTSSLSAPSTHRHLERKSRRKQRASLKYNKSETKRSPKRAETVATVSVLRNSSSNVKLKSDRSTFEKIKDTLKSPRNKLKKERHSSEDQLITDKSDPNIYSSRNPETSSEEDTPPHRNTPEPKNTSSDEETPNEDHSSVLSKSKPIPKGSRSTEMVRKARSKRNNKAQLLQSLSTSHITKPINSLSPQQNTMEQQDEEIQYTPRQNNGPSIDTCSSSESIPQCKTDPAIPVILVRSETDSNFDRNSIRLRSHTMNPNLQSLRGLTSDVYTNTVQNK